MGRVYKARSGLGLLEETGAAFGIGPARFGKDFDGHHAIQAQIVRLMTISSNGGEPRELPAWARIPCVWWGRAAWTSDSPTGNIFYRFQGPKLMAVRFDPKRSSFGDPSEVKFVPGSPVSLKPDDDWAVRGPGLVFSRDESVGSVWLMKLPL